jgi:hypothetical protein
VYAEVFKISVEGNKGRLSEEIFAADNGVFPTASGCGASAISQFFKLKCIP